MPNIVGFDPGGSTGVGHVIDGVVQQMWVLKGKDELYSWLREVLPTLGAQLAAVEDYIQRPDMMVKGAAHGQWTEQTTAKFIGAISYACELNGIRVVEQQPAIKPTGYKLAKLPYQPGKKGTHALDAIAHAFYLEVNGIVQRPSSSSKNPTTSPGRNGYRVARK